MLLFWMIRPQAIITSIKAIAGHIHQCPNHQTRPGRPPNPVCSARLPCLETARSTPPGAHPHACADAAFTFADPERVPWCFADYARNSTNTRALLGQSMIPLLLFIAYVCVVIFIVSTQQHCYKHTPAWQRMATKMCSSSTYYLKRTARCREGRSPKRRQSLMISKSELVPKRKTMRDIADSWRSF